MSPDRTTILDPLLANAESHPDKLLFAFLDRDGRTTESHSYETFLRRSGDIASHLHRTRRLDPGERVLLCYPPGLEVICAFFACVRLGLIPVPVYPPSGRGFDAALQKMNFIGKDCGAAAVLTDRALFWSMRLHRARSSIASLSFQRDHTSRLDWVVSADAEEDAGNDFPEAHSETLFLQYTSGSTSDPKGVMVTHRNVLNNCRNVFDHPPVGVSWLPQYHDMGLIGAYLFVGMVGGTTYGFSPVDFIQRPLLWLETIGRYRATASCAPNFAYDYCLRPDKIDDESLERLDLSSLRLLMTAAEPVRPDVFRGFLKRFQPCGLKAESFYAAYGLAEYTLAVTSRGRTIRSFEAAGMAEDQVRVAAPTAPASETTTLVSCGRPLGATKIRIVDVTGPPREAAPGRVGEIWINGPSKCRGYWERPELSRRIFEGRVQGRGHEDGTWLRTGDLGFIHDGELFVCGRAKDLIIIRGRNYYPQDIEAVVQEDPAIRKGCVAAFGVERDRSEVLVVVAELRKRRRRPDTEKINRRIREHLGVVASDFVYIPPRTIPKTSSGKIKRHEARVRWLDGRLKVIAHVQGSLSHAATEGDHHTPLERTFHRYGLTGTESQTLAEVGLDSLAMAEFAVDLEDHLENAGAVDLAGTVDIRWLQQIAICELFELLRQVDGSAPRAKLRFKQALASLRREHRENERRLMRRDARWDVDSGGQDLSAPSRPPEAEEGGVLLTGGTGFFGPFLLRSLLEQCGDEVYVLVRAENPDHGRKRLLEGLASAGASEGLLKDGDRRVTPVCGDLSRPRLGVPEAEWEVLSERIHTIYHNGALVNYLLDYEAMRATNVGGTRNVLRLASTGRTKILNQISTTFVFGWSSRDTLLESYDNEEMELLDFGYSQSKWVSEQLVLRAVRQGMPARVFRPALVTPSVDGHGRGFDIAMRLLAFMLKHGVTTTAQNQVSFCPADLVADNIVAVSNLPETVGQTFHATRDAYSSMLDITDILSRLTETRFRSYPLSEFVPFVIEHCEKDDLLFPLLNFLVRSVDNITAMEFKRYDNRNYRRARARSPSAREDPPLEDVVLGIVRFMRRQGVLSRQEKRTLQKS